MAYHQLLIDCIRCNKRFHIRYDDDEPLQEKVEFFCRACGTSLFFKLKHPPLSFCRDENLIAWEKHFFNKDRGVQDYGKILHRALKE